MRRELTSAEQRTLDVLHTHLGFTDAAKVATWIAEVRSLARPQYAPSREGYKCTACAVAPERFLDMRGDGYCAECLVYILSQNTQTKARIRGLADKIAGRLIRLRMKTTDDISTAYTNGVNDSMKHVHDILLRSVSETDSSFSDKALEDAIDEYAYAYHDEYGSESPWLHDITQSARARLLALIANR